MASLAFQVLKKNDSDASSIKAANHTCA